MNNSDIKNNLTKAIGIFLVAFFTLIISCNLYSQNSIKRFTKLSCPEKRWVIFHPFIAKKVNNISIDASQKAFDLKSDTALDGDINGGQLDAFRHAYWMSIITQKFGWRRARSLGIAHEKGNYKDFKKHRTEEGSLPDEKSGLMDFLNNDVGIQIGKDNLSANSEELTQIIKDQLLNGKLFVIKKNNYGDFLNCQNELISIEEIRGKWENSKCIVPSNYK